MERIRVAFVTPGAFPVPSPGSSSVEHAVKELADKLQNSAAVDVYGCLKKGFAKKERVSGVTYIRVSRVSQSGYAKNIVRRLKRRSYSLIQVENRPWLAAYIKRKLPQSRVWLSLHSLTYLSAERYGTRRLARWLASADRIMVNSCYLKEEVVKRFPLLERKLLVNHLGVNPEQFTSRWTEEGQMQRSGLLSGLKLENRKIILYVGRLIRLKGVHHLLAAMPGIIRRVPDAVLVVVGGAFYGSNRKTPYVRSLQRLAEQVPGCVRFVPFVPHDKIQEWFRIADLAVVPTPRREAFGLVNVEAMATGVPVLASAAGGMTEIVEHGRSGFLIHPERMEEELPDYAGMILNDPDLQRSLGAGGVERILHYFNWEQAAARWLQLIQEHTD